MNKMKSLLIPTALGVFMAYTGHAAATGVGGKIDKITIGADNNSRDNPFVQPQDPALSGGGLDQSMQFGDVLLGRFGNDLQIGGLGTDVLAGGHGNDVMIGGLEHFNPLNRDRAFGGSGSDVFIWKPGDGSDLFFGGRQQDAVVFGVVGENKDGGVAFEVLNDQVAGDVFIDPDTSLPLVDVTNSPGFCEVIDRHTSPEAKDELQALGLDHLVRFSLRGFRDSFEAGQQSEDNGLRVTLHLKDVEVLVCTSRDGGAIEILDLTVSPPQPINPNYLTRVLRKRLDAMVF